MDNTEGAVPTALRAEQALLGILILENDRFVDVDGTADGPDFVEPYHQRVFKAISRDIRAGKLIEPNALGQYFQIDPAFEAFGGIRYFIDLMDMAPPSNQAKHYANIVRQASVRREIIQIAAEIQTKAKEDTSASGESILADLEARIIAIKSSKAEVGLIPWGEAARSVLYGIDRPETRQLTKTGLVKIDNILGGAEKGDLILIAGRPGMGKSALASSIALNVALGGGGVAEINGEMSIDQMTRRHLSDYSYRQRGIEAPEYKRIRNNDLTDAHRRILVECFTECQNLPLYMVKRSGITLGRLRALLMKQKMIWESLGIPFDLAIIDHAGLVSPDQKGRSRFEDQTEVSGRLKELADELQVVMIALNQLNRDVEKREDKRPQLSDLRDSGSWEQDADVVLGVYRDSYYARREQEPRDHVKAAEWHIRCGSKTVEAIGLKVREGEPGTAKLWASIGHNNFRDNEPDLIS